GDAGDDAGTIDNVEIWANLSGGTTNDSVRGDVYETRVADAEQFSDTGASDETLVITLDTQITIAKNSSIEIAVVADLATGATAKYLGLESEEKYRGSGVSACATCDGFFYRGKDVAVVGGGDTACEEAAYLAGLCKKVYLIVRKDFLRASKAMQDRVMKTENIEILWEHNTKELTGENGVEGCTLIKKAGTPMEEEVKIAIDGFFLAIGHHPNSDVFANFVDTDKQGYILTQAGTPMTNVKGVFACGDVQDPNYRQAITSAASGCQAAIEAERFLAELN
ncbi:MAG: FAD-dependent oxidoreductase, partial [Labilibaculum sp.]|nr:FAD-dependent oxidoreductase [Labilibaculum sp.]